MFEEMYKYCERVSPEAWGEPINIVSNLAYLTVSILLVRLYQQQRNVVQRHDWDIRALIGLLFVIGLGSSLWHIYATNWALYFDAIPILTFINIYVLSCLYRIAGCSTTVTGILFLVYHVFNYGLQAIFEKDFLNGSIFYLPTWIFLVGITLFLKRNNVAVSRQYWWISVIFAIALFFRTVDFSVCDSFSVGTHFIWHIMSAYMMYLLVRILIVDSSRRVKSV